MKRVGGERDDDDGMRILMKMVGLEENGIKIVGGEWD